MKNFAKNYDNLSKTGGSNKALAKYAPAARVMLIRIIFLLFFQWYKGDEFGLRSLNEAGKVVRHTYPGLDHVYWYRTKEVYDKYIIPYLK